MKAKDIHFHRNGHTLVLNGVLFYGVREGKNHWVSQDGTFISPNQPNGDYRGSKCTSGHRQIYMNGRAVMAHRVVYEVWSGKEIGKGYEIDHINTVRDDNRLANLRCVTASENVRNPITYERLTRAGRTALAKFMSDPKNITDRRNKQVEERGRRVIGTCIATGETKLFKCIADAGKELKINHSNIVVCCKGITKKTHGWVFRYL